LPEEDAIVNLAEEIYRRRAESGVGVRLLAAIRDSEAASESYEIQWRVSRAMFLEGQAAERDVHRLHKAGIQHGRRATALRPNRVEGHFWLGVNMALLAQHTNAFRAAASVLKARRELKRAASICESYHGAGPLRVLGRLEHKAPWFLGGGLDRSRAYYDRALKVAPDNCVSLLYSAELEIDAGRPDHASGLLHKILEAPIDPEWEFEHQRDRELARVILARLARAPRFSDG
jgi:hypothetical protein